MISILLCALLVGYGTFLLGLSWFMHLESQKPGHNQFITKLLPPPAWWTPSQIQH